MNVYQMDRRLSTGKHMRIDLTHKKTVTQQKRLRWICFFPTKKSIVRWWSDIRRCGTRVFSAILAETVSYRFPKPVIKVLLLPNNDSFPLCPRCGISLEREYMAFCDRCGQHLAWNLFPLVINQYESTETEKRSVNSQIIKSNS